MLVLTIPTLVKSAMFLCHQSVSKAQQDYDVYTKKWSGFKGRTLSFTQTVQVASHNPSPRSTSHFDYKQKVCHTNIFNSPSVLEEMLFQPRVLALVSCTHSLSVSGTTTPYLIAISRVRIPLWRNRLKRNLSVKKRKAPEKSQI
ncbi:hypothetical protein BGZ60DRAFT_153435 [Tricladium varicosporioides]|nr:hypothetical protein BGZ60DRAFT_153435 [Hymenoscyphus varicosporioides]